MNLAIQKNLSLYLGASIVGVVVVMAAVSLFWTPHDPVQAVPADRLHGPSAQYWLGTDRFGRDIASRLFVGAQVSLFVGVIAVSISGLLGIPFGVWASMRGGWTDVVIMRGADLLLAFPALLLAIVAAAVFGPSVLTAMLAIGVSGGARLCSRRACWRAASAHAGLYFGGTHFRSSRAGDRVAPYLAEYSRDGHCAGVGGVCPGDFGRGRTEFLRPGRQPTASIMGVNAAGSADPTGHFPTAGGLARVGNCSDCVGL